MFQSEKRRGPKTVPFGMEKVGDSRLLQQISWWTTLEKEENKTNMTIRADTNIYITF